MAIRKRIWIYNDALPTFNQSFLTSNASNLSTFSLSNDYISSSSVLTGTGNLYNYADMTSVTDYVIQAGDYLEYDVYWVGTGNIQMSMDLHASDMTNLRDALGVTDQNGLSPHPSTDLSSRAYQKWYHRAIPITTFTGGSSIGKTIAYFNLVAEFDTAGTQVAYYKNIAITDGKGPAVYNTRNFIDFTGSTNGY
jgi:hypothetical protein